MLTCKLVTVASKSEVCSIKIPFADSVWKSLALRFQGAYATSMLEKKKTNHHVSQNWRTAGGEKNWKQKDAKTLHLIPPGFGKA